MEDGRERPRVALIAGTLGQGGAEKQLVYAARALAAAGVDVRVLCLTRGEPHEASLRAAGIPVDHVGEARGVARRLLRITRDMRQFRPQVVQAAHTYTNLYAALAARRAGALGIGALRSSVAHARAGNGAWTRWLLRCPSAVVANSHAAADELAKLPGLAPRRVYVVPNVIEARGSRPEVRTNPSAPCAAVVGRLVPAKRVDRFLESLALARREVPALRGVVVGDGPERGALERRAGELGLGPAVAFLGSRADVPSLLATVDVLVLSSDDEGFPNVLLEAMDAGRPVVATDVGDVREVVRDGATGYVVARSADALASRIVQLAKDPELGREMGEAGRARVCAEYGLPSLGGALIGVFRDLAMKEGHARAVAAFA